MGFPGEEESAWISRGFIGSSPWVDRRWEFFRHPDSLFDGVGINPNKSLYQGNGNHAFFSTPQKRAHEGRHVPTCSTRLGNISPTFFPVSMGPMPSGRERSMTALEDVAPIERPIMGTSFPAEAFHRRMFGS
jgi:hypothetical protein